MQSNRIAFLLLGVTLAFGFVVGSDRMSRAIALRRSQPEISVKGVATQDVRSNNGQLSVSSTRRSTNKLECQEKIENSRMKMMASLKALGIDEKSVTIYPLEYSIFEPAPVGAREVTTEKYASGNEREYKVSQNCLINTDQLDALMQYSLSEVGFVDDVMVTRGVPAFRVRQLDDAKRELLEAATKDARRRADILVSGSGSKVGALLDASQGVFEVLARESTRSRNYDEVDTSSIEKTVRVVVSLRFEIVPN